MLVGVVLGAIVGGIIGWITSYYFYQKQETSDTIMLRSLENEGFVEFKRNDMGEMTGIVRHGAIQAFVEGMLKSKAIDIKGVQD
jgi:hypothetical protein